MYAIGVNVKQGLYTKTEMRRGKIPAAGQIISTTIDGDAKVFVAVKLGATTWLNGTAVVIDGTGATVGAAVTASGSPSKQINNRVGILVFASATLTAVQAVTSFGWAQIYGQCLARVSASISLPGMALGIGAGPGALIKQAVAASGSTMLNGITALATSTAGTADLLLSVMLNYPQFRGQPDGNLA